MFDYSEVPQGVFQLTAARRRLASTVRKWLAMRAFQLTAARRRLGGARSHPNRFLPFQLTAARRRLVRIWFLTSFVTGFNSQPREGGWSPCQSFSVAGLSFNSQPREGGWLPVFGLFSHTAVSTHSRAKAAGTPFAIRRLTVEVSTHSRAKAAGKKDSTPSLGDAEILRVKHSPRDIALLSKHTTSVRPSFPCRFKR